jgi:acetyl esterase/lipase
VNLKDVDVSTDLEYVRLDGQPLLIDLYRPAGTARPPVVAYFHGGGWAAGSRADWAEQRAAALAQQGIAVACVQYRLTGTAPFPAQIEDARTAVSWLRDSGDKLALDTARVGAWGASAGGHLAALLGMSTGSGERAADAVVTWFAPLDIASGRARTPLETRLLGEPREGQVVAGDDEISGDPIRQITSDAAPFHILHGDRDQIVNYTVANRFHDRLTAAGVPSHLTILGGLGHEDPRFHQPHIIGSVAAFFHHTLAGSES